MVRTHPLLQNCTHKDTVTVIGAGLERVICSDCGHITIRYEAMISGEVSRSMFAREADSLATRKAGAHEKPVESEPGSE